MSLLKRRVAWLAGACCALASACIGGPPSSAPTGDTSSAPMDATSPDRGPADVPENSMGRQDTGGADGSSADMTRDTSTTDIRSRDGASLPTCGPEQSADCLPASSCTGAQDALGAAAVSGTYLLESGDTTFKAHCDMETDGGGWVRVVDFQFDGACPGDWQPASAPGVGACARELPDSGSRFAAFEPPYGYTEVRAYVLALQRGSPDGFARIDEMDDQLSEPYVDGVVFSTKLNGDEVHLWSYAAAYADSEPDRPFLQCPCLGGQQPPAWLGSDFSCESAVADGTGGQVNVWIAGDVLWDGMDGETCDSTGSPSWFVRQLDSSTTAPVTVRLVADESSANEDVGVYEMQVYVR